MESAGKSGCGESGSIGIGPTPRPRPLSAHSGVPPAQTAATPAQSLMQTSSTTPCPPSTTPPSAVGPSPPRRPPPPERMPLLERRRWHATSAEACFYIYFLSAYPELITRNYRAQAALQRRKAHMFALHRAQDQVRVCLHPEAPRARQGPQGKPLQEGRRHPALRSCRLC